MKIIYRKYKWKLFRVHDPGTLLKLNIEFSTTLNSYAQIQYSNE